LIITSYASADIALHRTRTAELNPSKSRPKPTLIPNQSISFSNPGLHAETLATGDPMSTCRLTSKGKMMATRISTAPRITSSLPPIPSLALRSKTARGSECGETRPEKPGWRQLSRCRHVHRSRVCPRETFRRSDFTGPRDSSISSRVVYILGSTFYVLSRFPLLWDIGLSLVMIYEYRS
jgi:hypothetical protein